MKPAFGIISWMPDDDYGRRKRMERLEVTLVQLYTYWPTVDIVILAQNWKDLRPRNMTSKVHLIMRDGRLGILGARTELRKEFLANTDYDYIIMTDDDLILQMPTNAQAAADELLRRMEQNPHGFAFIKADGGDRWFPFSPYRSATLNLGVVSRYIYEREGWAHYDIEAGIGCEDAIYPYLLHCKYSELEFDIPEGITHLQNDINPTNMPSCWVPSDISERQALAQKLYINTKKVMDYITEHHDLPC